MNIVIIPGFTSSPEDITFKELTEKLESAGHTVTKVTWPHIPHEMDKYSLSETIKEVRSIINKLESTDLALLGFSMGGIVASVLAKEFQPQKLGLIVSPYQVGSGDDLGEKFKEWRQTGFKEVDTSMYGKVRVPFSFIEDARQYNALDLVADIHCPLLFIVGDKDDTVPMAVTRKIYERAYEPKEWHAIAGMEHKYKYQTGMLARVNDIITEFIDRE